MQREFVLTPKELHFLGGILNAHYIDYFYISAMGGIQQQLQMHRREAYRHLTELGLLREDFSGAATVSPALQETLRPVFFGSTGTTVNLYKFGQQEPRRWRLHKLDEKITQVTLENGAFYLQQMDDAGLRRLAAQLMPLSMAETPARPLVRSRVQHAVVVRQATVGSPAYEEVWLGQNGFMYKDTREPELPYLDPKAFSEHIFDILKGEYIWRTTTD